MRGRVLGAALVAAVSAATLVCAGGSVAAPRFVILFRVAQPHATARQALALAASLGFDRPGVRTEASAFAASDRSGTRELVLYKASGGFDYVDRASYGTVPATPLPTKAEARAAGLALLRRHELLPGEDARISVRPDVSSSPRSLVMTVTPVAAGAPVLDGAITLWLGEHAAITRLRNEYRPLTAGAVRVLARPRNEVLREMRADLGTTNGIRMRLAYVAEPSYLQQPYLEPVYEAVARGFVLDRVPATTFTPRATILAPNPTNPIRAGATVRLRAKASAGTRPYRFVWYANRSGFLGTGKKLSAVLAADDTELRLTVRDASGAGMIYALPVWVYGPSPAAPAAGSAQQQNGEYGDGTVSFTAAQDRTHPLLFRDVRAGGTLRIDSAYFDQFRYSLAVRYQGTDYHLESRKCVPLTVPGDACTLPKSPYAQSGGASAPAGGGSGSWVYSTLAVDNLPGRLKLLVEGSAQSAYCGPSGELGAIALGMLSKYVYGTGGKIGGDCPGFRPSVEWSYQPPAVFRPSDFAQLCLQGESLCDVPRDLLLQWASGALDKGPQPQITDVRLNVYTAVESAGARERAALAQDSDSNTKLASTDGSIDTSCRPWHVAGGALGLLSRTDAFTCIRPVERERAAPLATTGGRGQWDNLHVKSESPAPYGISFPGCNHPMNASDIPDCIHLHEHWLGSTPGPSEAYSRGQNVTAYVVRWKPGEASPDSPESLVDGEALRANPDEGYDLAFWHRSSASSTQCYPGGGVDNTERPCLVFPQAMFFTPR